MLMAILVGVLVLAIAVALLAFALNSFRGDNRRERAVPDAAPAQPDHDDDAREQGAEPPRSAPRGEGPAIRVLVCDDSEWYCDLVGAWFEFEDDLELAGSAHDRESALQRVTDLQPDVVVLDTMTYGMQPVTVADVRAVAPAARVLLCSGYPREVAADRLGDADGYVGKDDGRERLIGTLRQLGRG